MFSNQVMIATQKVIFTWSHQSFGGIEAAIMDFSKISRDILYIFLELFLVHFHIYFVHNNGDISGLDKLRARWQASTQRARKEVFACTKLRARKSVKTLLSSAQKLFKLASCFCIWIQIFGTTGSDIYNLFQLRSCY